MTAKLNLAQLHANYLAVQESGWSTAQRGTAEAAYRARAVQIAAGLPFPHSLARLEHSRMATAHKDIVHIIAAEDINVGKLRRHAGQALCRGRYGFASRFNELVPEEAGAMCYTCLSIAEVHSIVEWQRDAS